MNKLAIPAVLAATVLIAGMFAFMPVEKASTVHSSIIAALQGANLVRMQIHIDDLKSISTPQGTSSAGDNNGSITWTQTITYDRTSGNGAFQIDKLFICDFQNKSGPPVNIGFDVETNLIDEDPTGRPSLRSHVGGEPVQILLLDSNQDEKCVDIRNVAFAPNQPDDEKQFIQAHLGGDLANNVVVHMFESSCDFNDTDTDGAYLVAYVVGLVDASQMDIFVDDTVSPCSND